MIVRIKVALAQEEYSGLVKLALSEMRNPQEQIRFVLRQELKHLGFLQENSKSHAINQSRHRRKRKNKANSQLEKYTQISNLEISEAGEHDD